jgi:hypothetical protein
MHITFSLAIFIIFCIIPCNGECSTEIQTVAEVCPCPPTKYWKYGYDAANDLEYYSCESCLDCPTGQYMDCSVQPLGSIPGDFVGPLRECHPCTNCSAGTQN